jgi:predicted nucleic acid-binding Zn ribbon protein
VSEATLFVEVRSSAWLMELDMMKDRILAKVNQGRDADVRIERLVFVLAEVDGS